MSLCDFSFDINLFVALDEAFKKKFIARTVKLFLIMIVFAQTGKTAMTVGEGVTKQLNKLNVNSDECLGKKCFNR